MKRILVLNYEFPPLGGGASPVSYELAKRLSETGDFDIDVVTMRYKGLPAYEEVNPHMRVHRVRCWRSKKEICHPWEQATYLVSGYFKCRELLRKNTYDICHCHFIIPTGVLAFRLKQKFGLEYVITAHGSDVPGFNTDRFKFLHTLTGPPLRKIARNAKTIISPSNYLKGLIAKSIDKDLAGKIIVIPNGIDTEKFKPQEKKNYIFSSGRLLRRKGFQYLIKAVSDENLGWEVHIAGDGPMMGELKKLAEKSKTKIVFHGWIDNTTEEYKDLLEQSAIFVLASNKESFGMVIAEAMSAGCMVITADAAGSSETVGESGILFVSHSINGLKTALMVINEPSKIELWGNSARKRAVKVYAYNRIMNEYIHTL
ncbi:MAG: glycosyltransferase family 4 protein [Minisyncoccia bacterium]|jgi:glycosyltransferase involved in cell wall biosynthesis